jgi:hypothetical protein
MSIEKKSYKVDVTYEEVELCLEIKAISDVSAECKSIQIIADNWKVDFKKVCDDVYSNNRINVTEIQKDLTTF